MKLTVYRLNGGRVEVVGSVWAGEEDNALVKDFPDVWGPGGKRLIPADGVAYLQAVHAELSRGTDRWSELTPLSVLERAAGRTPD